MAYLCVFIAQLVEHFSANAEAMGSNPVEDLKFVLGLIFVIAQIAITTGMIKSSFHLYSHSSKSLSIS